MVFVACRISSVFHIQHVDVDFLDLLADVVSLFNLGLAKGDSALFRFEVVFHGVAKIFLAGVLDDRGADDGVRACRICDARGGQRGGIPVYLNALRLEGHLLVVRRPLPKEIHEARLHRIDD